MNGGISYFPLDVYLDDKMNLIEAEFGLTGFAVVVKLFQKIYGGQGYYCEWTEDVALLFSRSVGLGGNVVSEIVSASIRRGIFDKDIYDKYRVLTSAGIQKRYFEAVSRRVSVDVKKEYLLVQFAQKYKNVNISEKNVDILSENVYSFGQSKVKESKVKKSTTIKEKNPQFEEEEFLPYDEGLRRILTAYEENFCMTVSKVHADEIADWRKSVEDDVIIFALKEAADNGKRNWSYARKIIENNFNCGRTTIAAVKAACEDFRNKKSQQGGGYEKIDWAN